MSKLADSLAGAALRLAELGWFVLALAKDGKAPAITRGVKNATRDARQIERWWRNGEFNIGVAAGAGSDLTIVDIDDEDAVEKLKQVASAYGGLPSTVTSRTPRGFHLFFRHVDGLRNRVRVPGLGVDVRNDDGYAVVPPSRLSVSERYAWLRSPWTTRVAPMPPWLREQLHDEQTPHSPTAPHRTGPPNRYGMGALHREAQTLARAGKGARNDELNRSAFRMGMLIDACGLSETEIIRQLVAACKTNGLLEDDGLRTVLATIQSGIRGGRANPRRLTDAAE
jgi:uncharacterized protein YndB with AHSA1/START domain